MSAAFLGDSLCGKRHYLAIFFSFFPLRPTDSYSFHSREFSLGPHRLFYPPFYLKYPSIRLAALLQTPSRIFCTVGLPQHRDVATSFVPMSAPLTAANKGISTAGKVFFGSLCAGTFGLGVWQTQRYFIKQTLVAQRQAELAQEPVTDLEVLSSYAQPGNGTETSFRKVRLRGTFRHDQEILVGPRGPPPGALPDKAGSSAQGMSSSPQGYFVLTPLVLTKSANQAAADAAEDTTVWVNRGWIPRHLGTSEQARGGRPRPQDGGGRYGVSAALTLETDASRRHGNPQYLQWERPVGDPDVAVTVVATKTEEPRFLVAEHELKTRPPKLFWFDAETLRALVPATGQTESTPIPNAATNTTTSSTRLLPTLVTQVREGDDVAGDRANKWPVTATADKIGDFKVSPAVHAGYAFTWYGLSLAGLYMTKVLLTKKP